MFYHSITEFVFLMNILGKRSDLPFSRKSDRKKEKSTVSFTHEQNVICSQTLLDDIAHEPRQTIICRQLFAGHVVDFRPMKRKKNLLRMIIIFIFLRFLKQFETLIPHLNLPCLIKNIARIIIIFNANWPCIISFLAAYVEVSLIHESRVLKQKKTLTKDPSGNPVFNETLTFHIPVGILHQTSLLVAVKNENAQRTEDQLLGRIFLGPTATGNQFEHWNEMRINNKPIARWHKLLD